MLMSIAALLSQFFLLTWSAPSWDQSPSVDTTDGDWSGYQHQTPNLMPPGADYEPYTGYTGLDEMFRSTRLQCDSTPHAADIAGEDASDAYPLATSNHCTSSSAASPEQDAERSCTSVIPPSDESFPSTWEEAKTLFSTPQEEAYLQQLSRAPFDNWYRRQIDAKMKKAITRIIRPYIGLEATARGRESVQKMLRKRLNSTWANEILKASPNEATLHRIALFLLPTFVRNAAYTLIHHDKVPPGVVCYIVKQGNLAGEMSGSATEDLRQYVLRRWERCKNSSA